MLLKSLDAAQSVILRHEAGLTTLCIAFVCPLESSQCHAVCVVSVGDSLAYVFKSTGLFHMAAMNASLIHE